MKWKLIYMALFLAMAAVTFCSAQISAKQLAQSGAGEEFVDLMHTFAAFVGDHEPAGALLGFFALHLVSLLAASLYLAFAVGGAAGDWIDKWREKRRQPQPGTE